MVLRDDDVCVARCYVLLPPKGEDCASNSGVSDVVLASTLAESTLEPKYHAALCRFILESGTMGMSALIDKVTPAIIPAGVISKRQLTKEINLLAVKEKRPGDRAARWYLR